MSNYNLGNEAARQLTEENANQDIVPVLKDNNQELINPDNSAFYSSTLEMFDQIPFNVDVAEKRILKVDPTEKEDSEIFTFENSISGGGIIKLDESKMTGDFLVTYDGANNIHTSTWLDMMSHPFHTLWKSAELQVNGVTITNSNTESLFVTDILNRLYSHNEKNSDLAGCCLGYRNSPGQHSFLSTITDTATSNTAKAHNKPAIKRIQALKKRNLCC